MDPQPPSWPSNEADGLPTPSPEPEHHEPDGLPEPADAPSAPLPEPPPPYGDLQVVVLIPDDGREPSLDISDDEARAVWEAVTAPWHPALLAESAGLPRYEDVDYPASPDPTELRVVASGFRTRLPSGFQTQSDDCGAVLIEAPDTRAKLVEQLVSGFVDATTALPPLDDPVALDFYALGAARWWLKDLTIGMGHADMLDVDSLTREAIAGARAWKAGDNATATNRLRAAFEILTQARERFYPVDAFFVDLCLVDTSTKPEALADSLTARAPVTFIAQGDAVARLAEESAETMATIRTGVDEGWVDLVGGAWSESDESIRPLNSILWQYRKGAEAYRANLDDRNVETFGRRRFGLHPQLPQLARRHGFRFAIHLGLDAGRFPTREETKRLWEAPDGTTLEALTRPPIAADADAYGVKLPWKLAKTMKDDHVATVPMVHWADHLAGWARDLRRVAAYSPVLARWVTVNDYFHLTDRPFENFQARIDEYESPYLSQSVARHESNPITKSTELVRLRARFEAAETLRALATSIGQTAGAEVDAVPASVAEDWLETGHIDRATEWIETETLGWAHALTRGLTGGQGGGRPGYLILNPLGVPRRVTVLLPDADADLRPEGPLRAAQFTEEGVWAVVDVAAYGFAWVPKHTDPSRPGAPVGVLGVRDRTLKNEILTVTLDPTTGGIRSLARVGEETARLGQQLVAMGFSHDDPHAATKMVGDDFEVDYGGPALVQARTRGSLVDPVDGRTIAKFEQRFRLWSGRPTLEIQVTLSEIADAFASEMSRSDPWRHYLACRWAWADPNSLVRRSYLHSVHTTEAERPETIEAIDISTRRQRTGLLFGGLAHHQRAGSRMLDTLLVAGDESSRTFTMGVVLDLDQPSPAVQDFETPPVVIPMESGPPMSGPAGWLVNVDSRNVAITALRFQENSGEGRGSGIVLDIAETSGRATRARIRFFKDPTWARQVDYQNEVIVDLTTEGDAVPVDLTPFEIARIDVTL